MQQTILYKRMKPEKPHYVDNEKFLERIKDYKKKKKQGLISKVPDDIAETIYNIAVSLAKCPKFNGYTYKDEMIADGVLNCLEKIDNFSTRKSKNPFAYFTQIIYFAFIRRIKGENKHSYIKNKMMQDFVHALQMEEPKMKKKKVLHYEQLHENWDKMERELLEKERMKHERKSRKRKKKNSNIW
ncbi:MAG: hypothetical protein N3A54_00460 [Patescibacteria group bacterium]|nr:hypothetical protein [Patescibacteria group bacterium]